MDPREYQDQSTDRRLHWKVGVVIACVAGVAATSLVHDDRSAAQETLGGRPKQAANGQNKGSPDAGAKAKLKAAKAAKTDAEKAAMKAAKAAKTAAEKAAAKAAKQAKMKAAKQAGKKAGKMDDAKAGRPTCPAGQLFDKRSKGCF